VMVNNNNNNNNNNNLVQENLVMHAYFKYFQMFSDVRQKCK
jgi:hypothetical protein